MSSNCSVHPERCIWELALSGAKSRADTAIRRMEMAEICAAELEAENARLRQDLNLAVSNAGKDLIAERDALRARVEKLREELSETRQHYYKIVSDRNALIARVEGSGSGGDKAIAESIRAFEEIPGHIVLERALDGRWCCARIKPGENIREIAAQPGLAIGRLSRRLAHLAALDEEGRSDDKDHV